MLAIKNLFFATACVVSTLGCGSPTPRNQPPTAVHATVKPALPPPKFDATDKSNAPFRVMASDGWKLVSFVPVDPVAEDAQLTAVFVNVLDDEVSARAAVMYVNLTPEEGRIFIESIRDQANDRVNAKVIRERIVEVDGLEAYEMIDVRNQPSGRVAFVVLALTNGKIGYMISCGGPIEQSERILPVCVEFVEGFRVKR